MLRECNRFADYDIDLNITKSICKPYLAARKAIETTHVISDVDNALCRKDSWDDDTKDRFASLGLSRMLPRGWGRSPGNLLESFAWRAQHADGQRSTRVMVVVIGPPVTRSRTLSSDSRAVAPMSSSDSRAVAPISSLESRALAPIHRSISMTSATGRLVRTMQEINDGDNARGRDAKTQRDAAALTTTEVWNDARSAITSLTRKVDEGTPTLLHDIDGSGDDTVFAVASPSGRRDAAAVATSQQKTDFLICYLDGVAREKVEELSQQKRCYYNAIVAHLKQAFEDPQHRYISRQALSACQHQTGESSATFANRLLNLLGPDIRYYIKLDNPLTFEQAVAKTQMVEQLLAEATADRLINPVGAARTIEVKAVAAEPPWTNFGERRYVRRSLSRTNRPRFFQQSAPARNQDVFRQHGIPDRRPIPSRSNCFNCGGLGHHARQCPSLSVQLPASGRRQSSLRGSLAFYDCQRLFSSFVNAVYPDSDSLSQELSQAREQINALSISLRNSQSACEQSEVRISALMKRNEELASSAFSQPSQSSLRSPHNLPDVRLLLACSLVLSLCTSTDAVCVNSPFSVPGTFNVINLVTMCYDRVPAGFRLGVSLAIVLLGAIPVVNGLVVIVSRIFLRVIAAWLRQRTSVPVEVLAIASRDQFFVAQIPVIVNGVLILALIDTGAAVTITSRDTAPLLGVFAMGVSDIPCAIGMTGVPVKLSGRADLRFEVGTLTLY
ncbi:hypothetical protein RB195_001519 [Necator americanus]|uniref:CCHC-type domain-containing protein n=1 Tax=Necator americanus TaxID=51031 RepID=A0ABR1DG41_NECAM